MARRTPEGPLDPGRLVFKEVTRERWNDFERLFAGKGGPKSCWCMVWRAMGEERDRTDGASRKSFMRRRVHDGVPVGILGYSGDEPVAWCSIAPRDTYKPLGGVEYEGVDPAKVWSVVCFYIPNAYRGGGLAHQLIRAAVKHARKRGARVVEAYPVDPDSPSYRFMGFIDAFKQAGFERRGRAGKRRHVMSLRLK